MCRHNVHLEQEHKRVVHCPMCRQVALVPASTLPPNWMLPASPAAAAEVVAAAAEVESDRAVQAREGQAERASYYRNLILMR